MSSLTHDTNLKRADALDVLRRVAADAGRGFIPFQPTFTFERTSRSKRFVRPWRSWTAVRRTPTWSSFVAQSADGSALKRNALLLALAAAEIDDKGIELPIAGDWTRNHGF